MSDTLAKDTVIQGLISYFEQYVSISEEMKVHIARECYIKIFAKNKFLSSPLEVLPPVYFLFSGAVRNFTRDCGEEVTTSIILENNIVGLTLFPGRIGSEGKQYIQAIEETVVALIPYKLFKILTILFPEMELLVRKLLWKQYLEAEERNFIVRLPTSIKRIARLEEVFPHLCSRVALKHLASFLAMRVETLSRLKSKRRYRAEKE